MSFIIWPLFWIPDKGQGPRIFSLENFIAEHLLYTHIWSGLTGYRIWGSNTFRLRIQGFISCSVFFLMLLVMPCWFCLFYISYFFLIPSFPSVLHPSVPLSLGPSTYPSAFKLCHVFFFFLIHVVIKCGMVFIMLSIQWDLSLFKLIFIYKRLVLPYAHFSKDISPLSFILSSFLNMFNLNLKSSEFSFSLSFQSLNYFQLTILEIFPNFIL